jgi:hypothetical protein
MHAMSNEKRFRLIFQAKLRNGDWEEDLDLDITAKESGLLNLMRTMYDSYEERLRHVFKMQSGSMPDGLVEDLLHLNRCLVFNQLKEHNGRTLLIKKV